MILSAQVQVVAQHKKLSFKHYSINDGLSQNAVLNILQDRDDFIWIGTEDGLNKFDGYDFTIYKHISKDKTSLSNSKISVLMEDPRGTLWIGTANGLNRYDRKLDQFESIDLDPQKKGEPHEIVTALQYDTRGNFWIGTLGGLKHYHADQEKISTYYLNDPKRYPGNNKVRAIFEDRQKFLWVSIGNDLKRFDPVKCVFLPLPEVLEKNNLLKGSIVRVIRQDAKGDYWFGTESQGLFHYQPAKGTCVNYRYDPKNANSIAGNIVRDLFFNSPSELWIGTRDGLSLMNTETGIFSKYQYNRYDDKALSHNSVRHIIKDRSGTLWIGTYYGGVNIFNPSNVNFSTIAEQLADNPGLNFPVVSSIITETDGGLYIGTEGGGLNYIDRKKNLYKSDWIKGNTHRIIKSMLKDEDGIIWLGTFDGLASLNTRTNKFNVHSLGQSADGTTNTQIFALAKNKQGLWLGTDGKGLIRIHQNGEQQVYLQTNEKHSISGNTVYALLNGPGNSLWIGTEKGLNIMDQNGLFRHYENEEANPNSINHNLVSALFTDSRGQLWVGTKGGGLNLLDQRSKKFYAINTTQGLANNIVHSIREDRKGNIWVSTNKGLSRITLKNLRLPLQPQMYSITNYTIADGLQSNQFGANAAAVGADDELLFGGINGITTFFPEQIVKNTHKPKVVLTELLIKNKVTDRLNEDSPLKASITETDKIILRHDQAFINIKFAALNYVNPAKNKYAYKLEGFEDDDWHYVGNQRTAAYTNLDAGKYRFMVKSANNDGVWNEVPKVISITVLPPWWKSWWAFTGYAFIIAFLLYLYYTYSLKTAALKNELVVESRIREKDNELYQRKLSFFTNISHEIKTPLTLILAPLDKLLDINSGNNRVQNQLMLMKRNGDRLVRLINQLLDFRKFESGSMALQAAEGNMVRFAREVVYAFDSYAHHLGIKLVVKSDQKSLRVWFDRDKFEKIMYNLLSNALKFTRPGGIITIYIREVAGESGDPFPAYASIEVEDNGSGIAEQHIGKIFDQFSHYDEDGNNQYGTGIGLAFTKGLVEIHQGSISVRSEEGKTGKYGLTCFTVKIPMGNAHLREEEMIADYKDSENIDAYNQLEEIQERPAFMEQKKEQVIASNQGDAPVLLIVEDNIDVMSFLTAHFEEKFKVYQAYNGKDGIEKAISVIPDIIISDVMMPEVSGTILCSTLKSDNRTSHIPIILLTARTPLIYKIEGLETGADDYLTKPFSIHIIEARVWNLLESRQQLRDRYKKEITLQPSKLAITSPDEIFLEKVMNFIENNMAEPSLNVEELGKEVFMSRVTLYRKIKALTNQTTIEFIRSVRLKKAAQYLETKSYSVTEAGYKVGFTDIDYFRKCFKEQFGKTPKEYARDQPET
jgi:ligand-binding sensor domain-containing protein/signal transduction histidine kinase/CheY-like chemotaxis protein/AraC-like DNA-binding protein